MSGAWVKQLDTKIDRFYFDRSVVVFFRSENPADLARSITLLRESEKVRSELIHNGLMFSRQNNWEKNKWEYLELVDKLGGVQFCSSVGKPVSTR